MYQPDVLYCIEHIARELDIACAVRSILRSRYDLDVRIHVFAHDQDRTLAAMNPRLVAVPFCRSRRDFGLERVLRLLPGVPIVNLAFEQLLSRANQTHRAPRDEFARQHVTHIAAGDFVRDWLLSAGVAAANIAQVGSLTCQLYRDPYRQLYLARRGELAARFGLDLDRPWIFLPENFVAAFFSRSQLRFRRRRGYDSAELHKYVEFSRESFRQIAEWCAAAAALHEVELIVRPRPAIAKNVFQQAFLAAAETSGERHLHFIKDGDVREWIFASQLVVSSYSSTLVEAAVAGKPVFLLLPSPMPVSASSAWTDASPVIRTRHEFLELTRSPTAAPAADGLRQWAETNLLSDGDAIENTAQLLAAACQGRQALPVPRHPHWSQAGVDGLRDALKRSERAIRRSLRRRRPKVIGHECDLTTIDEIEARTEVWRRLLASAGAGQAA